MTITDPIADMLTVIRNANSNRMDKLDVPASKAKVAILKLMKEKGYIVDYKRIEDNKQGILRIYLKFLGKARIPVIHKIKRISTPSRKMYVKNDKIPYVLGGIGMAVLSTHKGILSDVQARAQKIGGEVLCYIW